jgi:hypothetical protein
LSSNTRFRDFGNSGISSVPFKVLSPKRSCFSVPEDESQVKLRAC